MPLEILREKFFKKFNYNIMGKLGIAYALSFQIQKEE